MLLSFLLDIIPAEIGRDLGIGGSLLVVIYFFHKSFQSVLSSNATLITTLQQSNNQTLIEIHHSLKQIGDNFQKEREEISKRLDKIERIHEKHN